MSIATVLMFLATCAESENPAPKIVAVDPPSVSDRESTTVTFRGNNFFSRVIRFDLESAQDLEVDVTFSVAIDDQVLDVGSVRWVDPKSIEVRLPAGLPLGLHHATVTIPDGRSSTLVDAFDVLPCFSGNCGDGCCLGSENAISCPADCGSDCGNGSCDGDETAFTCSQDCIPTPFCDPALGELVACFEFEEADGSIELVDGSSAGNDASASNATFVPGILGSALQGSTAFDALIAESNSLDMESALTIEAWIQPDASISIGETGAGG
ncbi:MAG: hypothetical protein JKY56_11495 [Kofleriaceae bacterium]|nr:hypothetical protein [Kofleriaceae bacterium]